MPWIETPHLSMRYEAAGDGPETLLLLHEMGGTMESWDDVLPLLSPYYRVIRYDQRGAGMTERPPGPYGIREAGQDALALLDGLGVPGPVVPVGTAVGGAVALHLASAYPKRIRAAVATSPATGVPEGARQALLDRANEVEARGLRSFVGQGLDLGYPPPLRGDVARFARTRAQRLAADAVGQAATMRMLAKLDMRAALGRIRCPVLVLAGTHDLGRPPARVAPVAAAIPGATYRVVESGHFMAIQTPELLAKAVTDFLSAL
ncbi:alpha/beta fold hydrolase [Muricoccus aerilatus]|uniref:alpha/beta fold hydrolase n=1 Tax=Muricoccus aerilatus TaxID=452982 RepID=UPI0005C16439|nr:alpha/beta fold hydrolase [Roseomonas aerilata]